jgi:uncharacterized protein involved in exopolysaccharide biosynthesis
VSARQSPAIELLQRPAPHDADAAGRPVRLRVFIATFLVCALVGLAVNFLRPAVYRTGATMLTVKPAGVDQRSTEPDLEHVAIQRRLLLGDEVLESVAAGLRADGVAPEASPPALRRTLDVVPVADTNLVELRAEGGDPEMLQRAVSRWAEAYTDLRAARIAAETGRTTRELSEEQARLEEKIRTRRAELADFRDRHDIISMARNENEVMARLKGLQDSLNRARERAVDAQARVAAVNQAVERGRAVVPDHQKGELSRLLTRAKALRARLAELDTRYTREYLDMDPQLRELPAELESVEKRIEQLTSVGRQSVLEEAEQEAATAQAAVATLEAELADHKEHVAEFTARFAEQQALEEELARLEELLNDNQERLAQIEISNRQAYPPLQLVDSAPLPRDPVRPSYWRDALIVLGLSLTIALFATWLVDYLTGRNRRAAALIGGIRIYDRPYADSLPPATQGIGPRLAGAGPAAQLSQAWPRELEPGEAEALIRAAPPAVALQTALLLSGISPEELPALGGAVAPGSDRLEVPGPESRRLTLGPVVGQLAARSAADGRTGWPAPQKLEAELRLAAVDAGLSDAEEITPEAIRHTYICFLARQGARIDELPARVGALPADRLNGYARLSPPGANRPLAEVDPIYPALS